MLRLSGDEPGFAPLVLVYDLHTQVVVKPRKSMMCGQIWRSREEQSSLKERLARVAVEVIMYETQRSNRDSIHVQHGNPLVGGQRGISIVGRSDWKCKMCVTVT